MYQDEIAFIYLAKITEKRKKRKIQQKTLKQFIEGWEQDSPEELEHRMRNLQRIIFQIEKTN